MTATRKLPDAPRSSTQTDEGRDLAVGDLLVCAPETKQDAEFGIVVDVNARSAVVQRLPTRAVSEMPDRTVLVGFVVQQVTIRRVGACWGYSESLGPMWREEWPSEADHQRVAAWLKSNRTYCRAHAQLHNRQERQRVLEAMAAGK